MEKNLLAPVVVLALVLSGCSVVGKVAGMVPSEELQAANARITELEGQLAGKEAAIVEKQAELDTVNGQVTALRAQVSDLEGTNDELTARNEDLETLVCSDHTWTEFMEKDGFWPPQVWFDPSYAEAYDILVQEWNITPQMTQWTPITELWDEYLPGYLVVWDQSGMVWNVTQHCLLLDPTVYRDLAP